jgi:hypothetical protein
MVSPIGQGAVCPLWVDQRLSTIKPLAFGLDGRRPARSGHSLSTASFASPGTSFDHPVGADGQENQSMAARATFHEIRLLIRHDPDAKSHADAYVASRAIT